MSIPMTQMLNDNFLTEEEDAELNNKKNIKLGYFLDPNMGMVDEVTLVMWSMEKGSVYNINGGWKTVLDRNRKNLLNLAAGDEIELWSFRSVSGALCFVLVSNDTKRRMADADADQEDQVMMLEYGVEAGSSSQTQEHNDLTLEL
ncbi:Putative B3 domain-containing protein At5g35780 [Linum perenne]